MTEPRQVGSYTVLEQLAQGSQGTTFIASAPDGTRVVVKQFTIASMAGWKSLELFEREIETLRSLDHPGIPAFVDALDDEHAHYLVQEYIDGETLSALVAERAFTEDEVRRVADDVFDVLEYLHGRVPPVVHRDLKPSNIVRRPDGRHVVVDFGGVQNIVATDTGGSTVVGTTGYMPSEQLVGRAVPQSDYYALGATLAHLATGRHPADLPTKRLTLDWRADAALDGPLADAIDAMLRPAPEDRPEDVDAVRRILRGESDSLAIVPAAQPTAIERPQPKAIERPEPAFTELMEHRLSRFPDRLTIGLEEIDNPALAANDALGMIAGFVTMIVGIVAGLNLIIGAGVFVLATASMLHHIKTGSLDNRLTVYRDGRAKWERSTGDLSASDSGRLLLHDDELRIVRDDDEPIDVEHQLEEREEAWLREELQRFIQRPG